MIGSTFHADIYSGKGGVSTQNNGNATSTFFAPNESVVNLYATPVVGVEIKLSNSIKAQFLLEVTNITMKKNDLSVTISIFSGSSNEISTIFITPL